MDFGYFVAAYRHAGAGQMPAQFAPVQKVFEVHFLEIICSLVSSQVIFRYPLQVLLKWFLAVLIVPDILILSINTPSSFFAL